MTPVPASRLIAATLGLLTVIWTVGWLAREPVTAFSTAVLAHGGIPGLFALVVLTDPLPGIGFQGALFVGWTGGLHPFVIWAVVFAGSLSGSALTWAVGRGARRPLAGLLERYGVAAVLRKQRWRAVALASVTPLPFGVATLGAGAVGLTLRETMAGAIVRGLKIGVILSVIALGWGER